eukprot:4198045-Amphidinium_carterae.2
MTAHVGLKTTSQSWAAGREQTLQKTACSLKNEVNRGTERRKTFPDPADARFPHTRGDITR